VTLHELATAWQDMLPHYPTLVSQAAGCRTIVEFGVRGGVSTWAFLTGLPPDGELWSVDIIDVWPSLPEEVRLDPRLHFVLGDDRDTRTRGKLPLRADLVFIDSSHEYEHTVSELGYALAFDPRLIVMHDYVMPPVARAADEFCLREGWVVIDNELPYGLATLTPAGPA
jgi:predicted O-methyltransferase YrrM